MNLSLKISQIIYIFFLLTTYKSYGGTKADTEENIKHKSKNKDNSNVKSKADSNEEDDSETVIGKAPHKNKNILRIL